MAMGFTLQIRRSDTREGKSGALADQTIDVPFNHPPSFPFNRNRLSPLRAL